METSTLKKYAPEARKQFIEAVTNKAAVYGLLPNEILPVRKEGDVAIIGDRAFPASVAAQRGKLEARVRGQGFDQFVEAVAYTWFNRLVAIRYMELHGYLDHGYRVLSHPDGKSTPEIIENAERLQLPGLDRDNVVDLKLDGGKDEELYQKLLLAQCSALHQALPFLFSPIGGADELLLPDNLLHTDSLVRTLVNEIPEESWQEIEIIGWLYQFYISEKKDQVIGKVVKSEDIPAATQLFTPNWIVKYMVQNSLGAQWLATYPDSPLKRQMEYYIEPVEQTDEVNAQLAAITPDELNPEALTLIDPACGSGHILVEAYELFKAIYLERGYRQRDVPQLILEKNLYGLDIDGRAAQLSGFALMMKGRADDRRLFERGVKLNVMALVDSIGCDPEEIYSALLAIEQELQAAANEPPAPVGHLFETEDNLFTRAETNSAQRPPIAAYSLADIQELVKLFEHATTFGSLIQVPVELASKLPALRQLSEETSQDLFVSESLKRLGPLVQQAELLATQYDAVVANPPYMGAKFYCPALKDLVNMAFKAGKADLYGAFMLRNMQLVKGGGLVGMITIPNWMFLSSFAALRHAIYQDSPISSLVHIGRGVWGSDFGSCSFVLRRSMNHSLIGRFLRLFSKQGSVATNEDLERRFHVNPRFTTANTDFQEIPGGPVAYWAPSAAFESFSLEKMGEVGSVTQGLLTTDNNHFLRRWSEVDNRSTGFGFSRDEARDSGLRWFPINKGGTYRKWYGNLEFVVDWRNDGESLHLAVVTKYPYLKGKSGLVLKRTNPYFEPAATWTDISSSYFGARYLPAGVLYEKGGSAANWITPETATAVLAAKTAPYFLGLLNPTLHFQVGDVAALPIPPYSAIESHDINTKILIAYAEGDWNAYERSWDFQSLPILTDSTDASATLESSYTAWITQNRDTIAEMKRLEEENNRLFIDAYGLQDELTPDVPIEQITLTVNPAYRYGGKLSEEEQWTRFRQETMEELVSYAIGNMMGRYSLDHPGLIYAHSGNEGFDASKYTTFPADDDGIVPLTDVDWFADDACNRLIEFISKAWDSSHLEANLSFLADNLGPKKNESSRDTIRRYLCDKFFKDHLQTYKKRPIYWLFSSGKQKAFQCLVYLHRYNGGTLARMRTEYLVPLQGKINARIEQLESDIPSASSTSHRKTLEREQDKLIKQRDELRSFDDKLRHYADQRIELDLDDGVKVNYGKFGDLLADVKAITGKKPAGLAADRNA
ncbi:BREX-1 system adenine-specific DNA-methyltransferase PglX [Gimesia maris]|uniref:BREX-1 system adenine-specific DNA-methyltransferase PglX n=1 Tax=Gimesia maris TaxID=122 RepID=UPI003A8E579D